MKWHLKELIGRYESQNPNDSLSYRRIESDTGIGKTVITKIATNKAARLDLATMNTLLNYFSQKLGEELTVDDMLRWEPERRP